MSTRLQLLLLTLLPATALHAQPLMEISPDGRDTVIAVAPLAPLSFASDSVPFRTAPDWNLSLRMQVGGLAVGDLNRDGHEDVAVACYRSQSFPPYTDWRNFVLYNTGSQLQSAPGWWTRDSTSGTEVRIADLNNDQRPDLFCAYGDGSFPPDAVYFGTAADTLTGTAGWHAATSTWTTGAAVADVDLDGDLDVATSNQGVSPNPNRPVSIFFNQNGTLEQFPSWTSVDSEISSALSWGDVNNDGYPDLAVSKWVNFRSAVYVNDSGSVARSPGWTGNTTQGQKGIGWADLNGDSLQDLAVGGSIPTQAYLNTGGMPEPSPVWTSVNASHGTQDLTWADVDGDGDPDLATAEFSTGHFRIYLNRSGVLDAAPSWQYDSPSVGTAIAFGDINGDTRPDLIIGVSGEPCVSVFYNTLVTSAAGDPLPLAARPLEVYPNPFNPVTTAVFRLATAGPVTLVLYDLLGRETAVLLRNEFRAAGDHTVVVNGGGLVSGAYFLRLEAPEGRNGRRISTARVALVK
jgi:hypothetical protein